MSVKVKNYCLKMEKNKKICFEGFVGQLLNFSEKKNVYVPTNGYS